jgi:hypothetical protein
MKTFFLVIVERHIRNDEDRAAGVRDVVYARLEGDRDLIRYAVRQVLDRLTPTETYSVNLYGQDAPFRTNTDPTIIMEAPGERVRTSLWRWANTDRSHWQDIRPSSAVGLNLADRTDIIAPLNEEGERCPWPWDPQQLVGAPLGQYHCTYCGAMCVAGQPHIDYAGRVGGGPSA